MILVFGVNAMAIWLPDSPATSKRGWKMILTRTFKHPAIGVSEMVFATFAKEHRTIHDSVRHH